MSRLLIGFTIALACGVLVAQALAATSRGVALRDNFITVTAASAPHGTVSFSVTNRGTHTHNFRLQRVSSGAILFASKNIAPGRHISVSRVLTRGTYRLFCSIHPGMTKTFTVS